MAETPTNECSGPEYLRGGCGHDLKSDDLARGHVETEGILMCVECKNVCRMPQSAIAAPALAPSVGMRPPDNVEELAKAVAKTIEKTRNEILWGQLHQVGCLIRLVDGGYHLVNEKNLEAVRVDLEGALAKAREWLAPPKV